MLACEPPLLSSDRAGKGVAQREHKLWCESKMEQRRSSMLSWLSFGNRRMKKHTGTPERANFDFRRFNYEESTLLTTRSSSSRSSYSSCSSSSSTSSASSSPSSSTSSSYTDTKNNANPRVKSVLHLDKIFLYILPFVILLLCLI
jgi:hypothetical protein